MLNTSQAEVATKEAAAFVVGFDDDLGGIVIFDRLAAQLNVDSVVALFNIADVIVVASAARAQVGKHFSAMELGNAEVCIATQACEIRLHFFGAGHFIEFQLLDYDRHAVEHACVVHFHQQVAVLVVALCKANNSFCWGFCAGQQLAQIAITQVLIAVNTHSGPVDVSFYYGSRRAFCRLHLCNAGIDRWHYGWQIDCHVIFS